MKKNDDVGKCISSYWFLLLSAKFVCHNLRTGILHIGCMQYYNLQCIYTLQIKLHRWFIRYTNTTSVNCVTGIAYSSGAHEITPIFCGVCVAESSVFCIINSGLLFAHLYYSFWSLCYRFLDLRLLVVSFVSGNFCNINYNNIKNSFSRNKVL